MSRSSLAADLQSATWRCVVWTALQGLALLMPPIAALLYVALLGAAFLWLHGLRAGALRERAVLRLRPVCAPAALLAAGAVASVVLVVLTAVAYSRVVPHPVEPPTPLEEWLRRPAARPAAILLLVAVGPMIEEAIFRGWLQRTLERRVGVSLAVAVAALVFAAVHFDVRGIPLRFLMGVVFGAAVHLTRSLWAGVALHGGVNAGLLVLAAAVSFLGPTSNAIGAWGLALAVTAAAAATLWAGLRLRAIRRRHLGRGATCPCACAGRQQSSAGAA